MINNTWYAVLSSQELKPGCITAVKRFNQNLAFFTPVDDEHAIITLRFYNQVTGIHAIDKCIAWLGSHANNIIQRQGKRIVETQQPKKTALRIGENLLAADLPIIEYRSKRAELQKS